MIVIIRDSQDRETGINIEHCEYLFQRGNTLYLGRFFVRYPDETTAAKAAKRLFSFYEMKRNVCRIFDKAERVEEYRPEAAPDLFG